MKRDTRIVEGGRRREWTHGLVNPPVYRASTCLFDSYADLRAAVADPDSRLFYGRRGTPTHWAFQEAMLDLEGGAYCFLYPSGLSAITTAILAFVGPGDHLLVVDCVYEPTRAFCNASLKRLGVETTYFDPAAGSDIAALIRDNTRAVVVESPGSLTMEMQDIPAISQAAHERDAIVIMDNTWATPLLFDALSHGVDVTVNACTKYVAGHSDVMLGTATANDRTVGRLKRLTRQLGLTASPDDIYLAHRGLRTLPIRLRQHAAGATAVAQWLADHPNVDRVLYPALPDSAGHDLWQRDYDGASGLLSIVLNTGDYERIGAMVDDMRQFKMGFSWGGFESLILPSDPARVRTATDWQAPGPLLRLHIGLEDPADLIADLDDGLARLKTACA